MAEELNNEFDIQVRVQKAFTEATQEKVIANKLGKAREKSYIYV